jgi:hypothetical protein
MPKNSGQHEPIPRHFQNVAEAADFWDEHDLTDYWDLTREVDFEVDMQRRAFVTVLESELAKKLTACARQQGISTETLINVWLTEKIVATGQQK